MEIQPPTRYTVEDVAGLQNQIEQLKRSYAYDNEWIKFLAALAENNSIKDIVDYIKLVQWTDRQREALIMHTKGCLARGLSTTYFTGINDYRSALDDFELLDATLVLGMTRFDLSPEFHQVIGMINTHRKLDLRRSKGADFIHRLGAQRTELVVEETKTKEQGYKEKVLNRFTG